MVTNEYESLESQHSSVKSTLNSDLENIEQGHASAMKLMRDKYEREIGVLQDTLQHQLDAKNEEIMLLKSSYQQQQSTMMQRFENDLQTMKTYYEDRENVAKHELSSLHQSFDEALSRESTLKQSMLRSSFNNSFASPTSFTSPTQQQRSFTSPSQRSFASPTQRTLTSPTQRTFTPQNENDVQQELASLKQQVSTLSKSLSTSQKNLSIADLNQTTDDTSTDEYKQKYEILKAENERVRQVVTELQDEVQSRRKHHKNQNKKAKHMVDTIRQLKKDLAASEFKSKTKQSLLDAMIQK
eukprot:CAMPEP_0117423604 /NCGR_PEP_ID=MMETSP0758-20121206/4175_1 /TAXON_ID=63605 /ORGANISM="Percolomonas cosmopolitus, Strain AE-1 (ATCC 50343)" /LENGTH=297 /DNA_ID=CAMNT_0005206853 /DNA_START=434 /DNA_END=1327 /DNA_ORIENTATION=-